MKKLVLMFVAAIAIVSCASSCSNKSAADAAQATADSIRVADSIAAVEAAAAEAAAMDTTAVDSIAPAEGVVAE
ncbi:MAG: hypothetical protein RSA92_06410 [Bacteroidaceae bacterium]